VKLKDWSEEDPLQVLGQDPRNPDHLVAAGALNGGTSVSFDRGATWQERGTAPAYGPGIQALIDPNDGERMVIGGGFAESRDGARTWQYADRLRDTSSIQFGASSNLYVAAADGLLMRSPQAEPCTDRDDNFCARQGRFEMTVEWKTSSGLTGTARKVATGSEESGLFYFFDRNNWELLVKVLDGCAINQRFWVFTAGTTDVD
jgi:hypothetical protein